MTKKIETVHHIAVLQMLASKLTVFSNLKILITYSNFKDKTQAIMIERVSEDMKISCDRETLFLFYK